MKPSISITKTGTSSSMDLDRAMQRADRLTLAISKPTVKKAKKATLKKELDILNAAIQGVKEKLNK